MPPPPRGWGSPTASVNAAGNAAAPLPVLGGQEPPRPAEAALKHDQAKKSQAPPANAWAKKVPSPAPTVAVPKPLPELPGTAPAPAPPTTAADVPASSSSSSKKESTAPPKRNRDEPKPSSSSRGKPKSSLPCSFDAYVVLDFEATCENNQRLSKQEIIEFPMVVVDARSGDIVAEFQRYVKPVHCPTLSAFCTELTGITQEVVDQAKPFWEVFTEVLQWLDSASLVDAPNSNNTARSFCFVTCGDWDLKTMLPHQLGHLEQRLGRPLPSYFTRWINVKPIFNKYITTKGKISGMPDMLKAAGLSLEGRHHSGIDDCRNIAKILKKFLDRIASNPTNFPLLEPTFHLNRSADWKPWKNAAEELSWAHLTSSLSAFAPPTSEFDPSCTKPKNAAQEEQEGVTVDNSSPQMQSHRRALALLAAAPARDRQPNAQEMVTFSKKLSLVLRHRAEELNLPIGPGGMVPLGPLLKLPYFRYMDLPTLARLVRDSDKQRFRLQITPGDETKEDPTDADSIIAMVQIAANQGHSIQSIEADLKPITSVKDCPVAVHGTYLDAWDKILKGDGLSRMTRQHIHFAKGLPGTKEVISGMRQNVTVLAYLKVKEYLADGHLLFESHNGVILSPGVGTTGCIPVKYLTVTDRQGKVLYDSPTNA